MSSFALRTRRAFLLGSLAITTVACRQITWANGDRGSNDPSNPISQYFALLNQKKYDAAQRLLAPTFQARLGPDGVRLLVRSVRSAQVVDLVDAVAWANGLGANLPKPPSNRREFLVTLLVDPTDSSQTTWTAGTNRRFVDVVLESGNWSIDSISTSPGVLITGQNTTGGGSGTADTVVVPVAALRVGDAPIDHVIFDARQRAADRGDAPWATDPGAVLRRDGVSFGIAPDDEATTEAPDVDPVTLVPRVRIKVAHGDLPLVVTVVQPIRSGPGGVWAISQVRVVPPYPG